MKCERHTGKKPCGLPATVFAVGQNLCPAHAPTGDANCSHSLAPSGRCSYCGATTNPRSN